MDLIPALQPIINARDRKIVAYEALARWYIDGELKRPGNVQHCPRTTDLTMLRKLIEFSEPMRWMSQRLFVNVSQDTLESEQAYQTWRSALVDLLWEVAYPLTIEVVETVADEVLEMRWSDLRSFHVALALDDYGENFSQLERLMRFEWDYCKFDTRTLDRAKSLLATKYCAGKSILMIAEKVENIEHAQRAFGCGLDQHQGFHYYQPAVITEIFGSREAVC